MGSTDVQDELGSPLRDYYAGKFTIFPMKLDGLVKEKDSVCRYVKRMAVPKSMILADFQLVTKTLIPHSFILESGETPVGDEVMLLKEPLQD